MRLDAIWQAHRGWVVVVSAVLPVLACWLLSLAGDAVASTTAVLVLVVLVVIAAASGIRLAGIAAALTAAAGFDFFLTAPYHTFAIADADDIETAVLLLLVSAAVGEIALWGRRQAARASREQGYLDGVIAAAAGRSSVAQLTDQVARQITDVLRIDTARFDPATHHGGPTLGEDALVIRNGRILDVDRRGLPADEITVLPITNGGRVYGHYLLTSSTTIARPSRTQLRVAVLLAQQVGAALATERATTGVPEPEPPGISWPEPAAG